MTARKIDIDPDLWARIRVRAFNEQTTATALVHEALTELLARREAGPDAIAEARRRFPKAKAVEAADAAGAMAPPVPASPPKEDPWHDLTTQPPSSIGKTITDVEDARAIAAQIPTVRPVPKPTSKRTRTKRPSRSGTAGPEA